ncbi:MAG: hypothetical protein P8X57_07055, partial [Cyclobacteriaceae bacterium]
MIIGKEANMPQEQAARTAVYEEAGNEQSKMPEVEVSREPENEKPVVREVVYADAGVPLARENTNFDEVVESGLAEVIEGSANNRKYL